ncbi:Protein kinase C-like phorbol ester/diacylglycerol-binding domain [Arabidopsis thaliana x Arabidopsis arenosa]|uniref:Protein kinase C-like phorbol ester/diacylglycerol-binding domain n=1 Tax=Arabidopsis thaliana x Arabidopsis arenosa TaxID=1240361 RepID=A0A8T1ZMG7_9BRAS|nr:Protein kinase C-like phorbol ester/diacylglycerol-binding domain [Arabidopsis thaliana x Arabidopsis arenosa]
MEKVELPVHNHPLIPFTRFHHGLCAGCWSDSNGYIYGGYICNELGCNSVFHKECAESAAEINHHSHPNHPLKLFLAYKPFDCSLCGDSPRVGYSCSICDFKLDLSCARQPPPPQPAALEDFMVHEHPLILSNRREVELTLLKSNCKVCETSFFNSRQIYHCHQCDFLFHKECVELFPEAYHTCHPKHPLKFLTCGPPGYAEQKCLLCGKEFEEQLHHCDVCNFSICKRCARNPPPIGVVSPKTHEHTLHLVPRVVDFTCNACGTQGDRSPYFCLQCNFMIHRDCIDLPRVININRHDHRISYTSYLGHGSWTCGVCRKKVDGFYGAYFCSKCPSYAVHSRCATRYDVWDKIELEGTPEDIEDIAPFIVIDDYTIKHFSHDHNLKLNKDGDILQEDRLCEACVFQIYNDPYYSCEQCDFVLHETCANMSRKKRHVSNNIPFTLETDSSRDSPRQQNQCTICNKYFTGFRYTSTYLTLDVWCGSFSEPFFHKSHPHPLYYKYERHRSPDANGEHQSCDMLCCDECPFTMDFKCAFLPTKVMKHRYDDHPLILSYGEDNVDASYWRLLVSYARTHSFKRKLIWSSGSQHFYL